jgi:hypothetical protein
MEILAIVITFAQLALKYGVPMAVDLLALWKQEDPECRDWEKLRDMVPIDEEFIPQKGD